MSIDQQCIHVLEKPLNVSLINRPLKSKVRKTEVVPIPVCKEPSAFNSNTLLLDRSLV